MLLCADSIEANVESASVNVEHGVEQLQRARNYQVVRVLGSFVRFLLSFHCQMAAISLRSFR